MPEPETLPTTLLTGFLGSGKTTLLRRALVSPELSDTAVIINEIGEIAIDHHLVDFVEGDVLEQAAQSARQVLAYRAAQAAARQFENIALDKVDEVMIDRDLADLVENDGGVGEFRRHQCPAQ